MRNKKNPLRPDLQQALLTARQLKKEATVEQDEFEDELSLWDSLQASQLLIKMIVKYGYSWLPTSLQETGKQIALLYPLLITLHIMGRAVFVPLYAISGLPQSLAASALAYLGTSYWAHKQEAQLLQQGIPAVTNGHVTILSLLTEPVVASRLVRGLGLLSNGLILLLGSSGLLETEPLDSLGLEALTAPYLSFLAMWILTVDIWGNHLLTASTKNENSPTEELPFSE